MIPPETINVLDQHGGFTAETPTQGRHSGLMDGPKNTLWRPGNLLKKTTVGKLLTWKGNSFYQNNNDVTKARYKVPGYGYTVVLWFDNATGRRIA